MRSKTTWLMTATLLGALLVPMAPGAVAETITKEWTQTSQTDFLQGTTSGVDVHSAPGSVSMGPDLPTDKTKWRRDRGNDFWSQQSSPYVASGQGSLFHHTRYQSCNGCSYFDEISTSATGKDSVTVYVYPSSIYQRGSYSSYIRLYLRFTDGVYTQDNFLRSVESSNWDSYRESWGSYSDYVNINGWWWYKFTFNVPSHFNENNLRASLYTHTYMGGWWSCCTLDIYMQNYVAFGMPTQATFTSNVHNAGGLAKFDTITYSGSVPAGSSLTVETRTSGDGATWSPWARALSGEPVPSPGGSFAQYRAVFTLPPGSTGVPRLDDVTIRYSITQDTSPPRTVAAVGGVAGCAGWIVNGATVTLNAQDDLSGVAATYASLNGGFFERYTGPFAVADGAHTLEYYSVDGAGNVESPKTTTFKVDQTAPATGLDLGAPAYQADRLYVGPTSAFTLLPEDATSGVKATRVDTGAGFGAYAGAFALGGADGARSVRYASEDRACNVEPTRTVDVFVDGTAPSVALTNPKPSSFSVLGRSSGEVAEFEMAQGRLAEFGIYGSDADVLSDLVVAGAHEMCGPVMAAECATLALSGLAPRLGGAVVVGSLTVTAEAADPVVNGGASGLSHVAFYLDGELMAVDAAAPFEWAWDATNASMGRHDLTVVAEDNLGNAASVTNGVSVLPVGFGGVLETGAFVLQKASAPEFAVGIYEFVRAKVEAATPPPPPPPGEILPPIEPPVQPPPLPVEPPTEPPTEPPADVPTVCAGGVCSDEPPTLPPVNPPPPPNPPQRICIGNTCIPG